MPEDEHLKKRRVIAFFSRPINNTITEISNDASRSIWKSVTKAAEADGCNFITVVGGVIGSGPGNILYSLFPKSGIDGILTRCSFENDGSDRFFLQFEGIPAVALSVHVRDYPLISVSNRGEMSAVTEHLILSHGKKKLAYIFGETNHPYAKERYLGYRDALDKYSIAFDDRLFYPPTSWNKQTGIDAVRCFIDTRNLQPGIDFEAIICPNDRIALGVLEELDRRNIPVPGTVALTGFNNFIEARQSIPAITSVGTSFFSQGRKAYEILNDLIDGKSVPDTVRIPGYVMLHESCGCPRFSVSTAYDSETKKWSGDGHSSDVSDFDIPADQKKLMLQNLSQIFESFENQMLNLTPEEFSESFIAALKNRDSKVFTQLLFETILYRRDNAYDLLNWNEAMLCVRKYIRKTTDSLLVMSLCDELIIKASLFASDIDIRIKTGETFHQVSLSEILASVDGMLSASHSMEDIFSIILNQFPRMGIPYLYTVFFSPFYNCSTGPEFFPEWSRVVCGYDRSGPLDPGTAGIPFRASDILPGGLMDGSSRVSFMMLPLSFGSEVYGYVLFGVDKCLNIAYETLALKISNAIKSALLKTDLEERSKALQKAQSGLERERYILNAFMSSLPDMVHFKDKYGVITRANRAFALWYGYQSSFMVAGKHCSEVYRNEDPNDVSERDHQIVELGQQVVNSEEELESADGRRRLFLVSRLPIYEEGAIIGSFEIARDITDVYDARRKIAVSEKMAATATLIAGIAHEINTPIGVSITASSLIRKSGESVFSKLKNGALTKSELEKFISDMSDSSEIIESNLERAADLISHFKEISVGQPREEMKEFDIVRQIFDVIKKLSPKINEGGHSAEVTGEPLRIRSYPEAVDHIFSNLIMNSINHGFSGIRGGEIRITVGCEGHLVRIVYSDNGCGMSRETVAKMYTPFFSTKKQHGGTGLGMHIVYNTVTQLLGGEINCESEIGKGTVFTILFPAKNPL
jgi:PAS domain S-box-containing protein